MIRFEFETQDSVVSITHKNNEDITWIDMILHFSDCLNGATYVIDKEVLETHLEAAAQEMRDNVYAQVAARTKESESE